MFTKTSIDLLRKREIARETKRVYESVDCIHAPNNFAGVNIAQVPAQYSLLISTTSHWHSMWRVL